MSKLNKKDRASLCLFTFSDGRRCRTPRARNHPHFCFDHAQKEARARAAKNIGKDLAYFFSGDYLSACDLSTALSRIIPAVVRGDIKPKTARTVAYLAQTLLQSIRLAQHEYIEAFSTNRWRNAIANSVNENRDYLVPPAPTPPQTQSPQPAASPVNSHSERSEEPAFSSSSAPVPTPPPAPPSPVVAGLPQSLRSDPVGQTGAVQAALPVAPPVPTMPKEPAPTPTQAPPRRAHPGQSPTVNSAPTTPPPPAPPDRSAHWLDWDSIQGVRRVNKPL